MANEPAGADRPAFLTVAEVASLLRVSNMTVYRLINAGDMPAARVGKSYRIAQRDVDRYLDDAYTASA
ncbi:MAG: helix-turn-helix domain-containing protein [Acidimicrobiales bacterium]